MSGLYWGPVHQKISRHIRVVAYERAGFDASTHDSGQAAGLTEPLLTAVVASSSSVSAAHAIVAELAHVADGREAAAGPLVGERSARWTPWASGASGCTPSASRERMSDRDQDGGRRRGADPRSECRPRCGVTE